MIYPHKVREESKIEPVPPPREWKLFAASCLVRTCTGKVIHYAASTIADNSQSAEDHLLAISVKQYPCTEYFGHEVNVKEIPSRVIERLDYVKTS